MQNIVTLWRFLLPIKGFLKTDLGSLYCIQSILVYTNLF